MLPRPMKPIAAIVLSCMVIRGDCSARFEKAVYPLRLQLGHGSIAPLRVPVLVDQQCTHALGKLTELKTADGQLQLLSEHSFELFVGCSMPLAPEDRH